VKHIKNHLIEEGKVMNTVKIRNLEIGKGMPKICVPVVGRTRAEIREAAAYVELNRRMSGAGNFGKRKGSHCGTSGCGGMESRLVYRSVPMGMCGIYAAGYA